MYHFTDTDDCNQDPCVNGICEDQVNGYLCVCDAGYNDTDCDNDINDCSPNPCPNGGTCTDDVDSFNCTCADGYGGNTCGEGKRGEIQMSST